MKRIAISLLIIITSLAIFSSCLVVSLHPLGDESQQIWKPELLGVWEGESIGVRYQYVITRHPKQESGNYLIKRVFLMPDMNFGNSSEEFAIPDSAMQYLQEHREEVARKMQTLSDADFATMFSTVDDQGKLQPNSRMGRRALFSEMPLPGDTTVFAANMFKVGEHYYMDLFGQGTEKLWENFIPVHTFMRIDFESDKSFLISELKSQKLSTLFEENRIRLPHQITPDGTTLITAESHKIQEFLKKYTADPEVFEMPSPYTKLP